MDVLKKLYGTSLALLTDFYQLTMAQAYWESGTSEKESVFHMYFRKNPFEGGFTIACGLAYAIDLLKNLQFSDDDLAYLSSLTGSDGKVLFKKPFLDYLKELKFCCDIDAVPEGTIVLPQEPLLRVKGPLIQAQLIETLLLNIINFQSLIATKAARLRIASEGDPIFEFGLRRAQGIDGGLAASRAAYIGGCSSTSNVLAGKLFDIPVKGTHAHSWVMAFDDELEAFDSYAAVMPNNCVFLVDTYDTIEGVKNAIIAGKKLAEKGFKLLGIRLDSGDLAYLSIEARKLLDASGFHDTQILASNNLDEKVIDSLKDQKARIDSWGVGTKLATAYDQPALNGVYKLAAIREKEGDWQYKLKLSEQAVKVSNPGLLQVRRYYEKDEYIADMIYNVASGLEEEPVMIDPFDATRRKKLKKKLNHKDLLISIFKKGKLVYDIPDIHTTKAYTEKELDKFHTGIKRFVNPHSYPVGFEKKLYDLKTSLILKLRKTLG